MGEEKLFQNQGYAIRRLYTDGIFRAYLPAINVPSTRFKKVLPCAKKKTKIVPTWRVKR